ncbi:MAG: hypothetical protein Q8O72_02445 [Bacteroidales bacterium]|jgi:hypothetical protein|nr:hypothetical protein [Bacteroidales bacterium]
MNNEIEKYREPFPKEYETLDRTALEKRLSAFIRDLIENDFSKLHTMIYRHDVNEARFALALKETTIELQARAIAQLVIERELQKIETRKLYKRK